MEITPGQLQDEEALGHVRYCRAIGVKDNRLIFISAKLDKNGINSAYKDSLPYKQFEEKGFSPLYFRLITPRDSGENKPIISLIPPDDTETSELIKKINHAAALFSAFENSSLGL